MSHEGAILTSTDGTPVPLEGVVATGTVRGLLLELSVEQRYRNRGRANLEVVYTFPLPVHAVLLDVEVELGGRKLAGVVVEKREAERNYEAAIDQGDTAIMLERAGDGLYTLNLGNLMAGEGAVVRIRYAQLLRFEQGSVRVTVPTVIAPRYGEAVSVGGLQAHQAPVTNLCAAYPFALSLDLEGEVAAGAIGSPTHAIATRRTSRGMHVALSRDVFLDRDFVLEIGALQGRSLATVAHDGDGYVALASFVADVPQAGESMPLRLKVLLDCSGSMQGDSIGASRRALHRVLEALVPADRIAFSRFGSSVRHETNGLRAADAACIRQVADCVARLEADLGGTELARALESVFAIDAGAADILLITDGEVWDSNALSEAARASGQRVFVVGMGAAPAEGPLERLAESSGGACEFVTPGEDAEAAIVCMFARLRATRVERAVVHWPGTPAWTTSLEGGLFGGETLHVFAGYDQAPEGEVRLSLMPRDDAPALTSRVCLSDPVPHARTLARVAASRRIETATEAQQLSLALGYGLVTSRTNLVVVLERAAGEKAAGLPELAKVAQMHAAGWHGVGSVHSEVLYDRVASFDVLSASGSLKHSAGRAVHGGIANKLDLHVSLDVDSELSPVPGHAQPASSPPDLESFLRKLEATPGSRLPSTLQGLADLGLPAAILDELRATAAGQGPAEADVLRAFYAALHELLDADVLPFTASRALLRALRHHSGTGVDPALRDRIAVTLADRDPVRF